MIEYCIIYGTGAIWVIIGPDQKISTCKTGYLVRSNQNSMLPSYGSTMCLNHFRLPRQYDVNLSKGKGIWGENANGQQSATVVYLVLIYVTLHLLGNEKCERKRSICLHTTRLLLALRADA